MLKVISDFINSIQSKWIKENYNLIERNFSYTLFLRRLGMIAVPIVSLYFFCKKEWFWNSIDINEYLEKIKANFTLYANVGAEKEEKQLNTSVTIESLSKEIARMEKIFEQNLKMNKMNKQEKTELYKDLFWHIDGLCYNKLRKNQVKESKGFLEDVNILLEKFDKDIILYDNKDKDDFSVAAKKEAISLVIQRIQKINADNADNARWIYATLYKALAADPQCTLDAIKGSEINDHQCIAQIAKLQKLLSAKEMDVLITQVKSSRNEYRRKLEYLDNVLLESAAKVVGKNNKVPKAYALLCEIEKLKKINEIQENIRLFSDIVENSELQQKHKELLNGGMNNDNGVKRTLQDKRATITQNIHNKISKKIEDLDKKGLSSPDNWEQSKFLGNCKTILNTLKYIKLAHEEICHSINVCVKDKYAKALGWHVLFETAASYIQTQEKLLNMSLYGQISNKSALESALNKLPLSDKEESLESIKSFVTDTYDKFFDDTLNEDLYEKINPTYNPNRGYTLNEIKEFLNKEIKVVRYLEKLHALHSFLFNSVKKDKSQQSANISSKEEIQGSIVKTLTNIANGNKKYTCKYIKSLFKFNKNHIVGLSNINSKITGSNVDFKQSACIDNGDSKLDSRLFFNHNGMNRISVGPPTSPTSPTSEQVQEEHPDMFAQEIPCIIL